MPTTGLDYFGYFYVNGRYFHVSNLSNWSAVAKPVRGSTAKHKGKAQPIFTFVDGKCEVSLGMLLMGSRRRMSSSLCISGVSWMRGPLHLLSVNVVSCAGSCSCMFSCFRPRVL